MKKILISIILIISLCSCFLFASCKKSSYNSGITARFLTNYGGAKETLSSGREVTSENTLFESVEVKSGEKLKKPETDPTRPGYRFVAWATDKAGTTLYDFDAAVTHSINLYATWERDEAAVIGAEDYVEPVLSFKEDKSGTSPFQWTQVCGAFIETQGSLKTVALTTAGIKRLTAKKENVKTLLGYKLNATTEITEAKYADNVITVKYTSGGSSYTEQVTVTDVTASHVVENQYEVKALKYEANYDIDSYKVVMGGSSSMENWSTSGEDMAPVTTINVGIGGTTADQWADHLAARLIIPYNPRAVVLYVGINDIINRYKSAETTTQDLKRLFTVIHTALPDTLVHFILINHVPGYYSASSAAKIRDHSAAIDATNNAIIAYAGQSGNEYLRIIDAGTCLEKDAKYAVNGKLSYSNAYFRNDGLHMSVAGYVLWGAEVKKAVIAADKERYVK